MSLRDRFEILGPKGDDQARSFEAREIATGRPVLVHWLPPNSPLLDKVDALPPLERGRVIDRGEEAGETYLITDRLPEYSGFSEWLSKAAKPLSMGGAWQVRPPVSPPARPPSADTQFVKLFDDPPVPSTTLPSTPVLTDTGQVTLKMPPPLQAEPASGPPPAAPPPHQNEPGEFTRQFAPVLRPAPPPPQKPEPAPAPPQNAPGEFTRLFQTPMRPAPAPAPKPEPAKPQNEPGEFTRQFTPVMRPAPTPKPDPAPAPAPAPPKNNPPGEFTRLFQSPMRPAPQPASPPAPPSAAVPGEFTQMLQAQPAGPPAPAAPAPSDSKQGEFTRFFETAMTPPSPPAAPLAPPVPPRTNFQSGGGGEFTQVFGKLDLPVPPAGPRSVSTTSTPAFQEEPLPTLSFEKGASPAAPVFPSPGISTQVPKAPGDYTRQFSSPAPLTFGQPQVASQIPRGPLSVNLPPVAIPPVKKRNILPLILIVSAVLLLAAAIVVYVLTRPHRP